MREIKFEAINKVSKRKIGSDMLIFNNGDFFADFREFEDGIPLNQNEWAIRQFTGLKDYKGKGIYEGDFMHSDNFSKMAISFVDGCFVGKSTVKVQALNWKPSSLVGLNMLRYEVIGNIYENPELLKEESQ